MRMSCNSTYLLDQETDHGVKADELAALLDGVFVQPEAKAVVFSQWTRTHDIVIRRLEERGIGYVSFHGGVPSTSGRRWSSAFATIRTAASSCPPTRARRAQPAARLDPGEHGPAVEPGASGAAHRAHSPHGQKRPVQIVNFVAKGTIEEGMLSVLAFKRSLSAGILDGGRARSRSAARA